MLIGLIVGCAVGVLLENPLAGFGAFIVVILLEIFIIDHFDDIFV